MCLSTDKVVATFFWETCGIIHIDYLLKGRIINGETYAKLLVGFDDDLKKKLPQDNASHTGLWPLWQNSVSWDTNCSHIRHILIIWPFLTIYSLKKSHGIAWKMSTLRTSKTFYYMKSIQKIEKRRTFFVKNFMLHSETD